MKRIELWLLLNVYQQGSSIKDVLGEGDGVSSDTGKRRGGLIACVRPQLSFTLRLAVLVCAAAWPLLSPLQWRLRMY